MIQGLFHFLSSSLYVQRTSEGSFLITCQSALGNYYGLLENAL